MKRIAYVSQRLLDLTHVVSNWTLRRFATIGAVLALLAVSMSPASAVSPRSVSPVSYGGNPATLSLTRVTVRSSVTWRGGAANTHWSNPANWDGGRTPGPFDMVRFDGGTADALVDPAFAGSVAGIVVGHDYAGTLRLGRALTIRGDFVIGGGTFAQNDFALTMVALSESGGVFNGGAAPLWIEDTARVSGGVLTTPSTTLRALSLDIQAPGIVRMASDGALRLAGDGVPLTGDGLLDTLTHRPNSLEYTGRATADVTAATPYRALASVGRQTSPQPNRTLASANGARSLAATTFSRAGSLSLQGGGEFMPNTAAIDTANGFAYFGTWTQPGIVVKVRLSDFTRIGALTLNPGEDDISSAVIDTVQGFAYFGRYTFPGTPGSVVKVRLSDFTRVGALTLNPDEDGIDTAVIDTAHGFAYFGCNYHVVKVQLSDFTRVGKLDLFEAGVNTAVIDTANGFAYFGTYMPPNAVVEKVRLSNFTKVSSLTLNAGDGSPISAVIDTAHGLAYFGTDTSPGNVVKVDVNPAHSLARVGALTLDTGEDALYSAVIDTAHGFAYFGMGTNPGFVAKVQLSTFARVGALTLNTGEEYLNSAVIDTANGFAYFGFDVIGSGGVLKVRLSDFTRVGALTLKNGEGSIDSAVIDTANGFAYFGATGLDGGIVVKVRLLDFKRVGTLTLNAGEFALSPAVIDTNHGFAYFKTVGNLASPGGIVKVDVNPAHSFARVGALTFNSGEDDISSAVIDTVNGFAYFGTGWYVSPGIVVKVRLSDFTRVGALTLNTGEDTLKAAVIDTTHGFAYFGTVGGLDNPSFVVKVDVNPAHSFARVGALTLGYDQSVFSAVIDTANGFAYFGTHNSPGGIVKVDVNPAHSFARVDAVTFNFGEDEILSAVIDTVNGFAYFGTYTQPGIVVTVRLSDLTEVDSLTLNPGEENLDSAAIDTLRGFAYFGTSTLPGLVVKVDLGYPRLYLYLPQIRR